MDTDHVKINKPWNELYKQVLYDNKQNVSVGMESKETQLVPSNWLTKVRLSLSGKSYVTIRRIRIRIVPLVSRKAGVSGALYFRDISDTTDRKLHCSERLALGREVRLEMPHLDFALSAEEDVPIVFGFEGLVSPFLEGRALFSVSLSWQIGLSSRCYSLKEARMTVQYLEDTLMKPVIAKKLKTSAKTTGAKVSRQTLPAEGCE